MSEKKVLLRFHLSNERERRAWELLLNRKQQDGCSYGDVVMEALLASGVRATEISSTQEDRIVERIKEALASCSIQAGSPSVIEAAQEANEEAGAADEMDAYADVDWSFAGG